MKKLTLGSLALILMTSTAAEAQGLMAAGATDWSGFYAGVHAGGAFTGSNTGVDVHGYNYTPGAAIDINNASDFVGGVQLGYNWQFDSLVLGVEGDVSYLGYSASGSDAAWPDTVYTASADWLATVRLRAGAVFDSTLIYATGGLALADLKYGTVDNCVGGACGVDTIDASLSRSLGYVVGAGIEHDFGNRWSLKGEYLFAGFDGGTATGAALTGGDYDFDFGSTGIHTVRLGLNYRF
ncbi:outer membrane beta-barrel protein [Rhizobium pusense]|uniref:outer membrane protein n=1 Tax=Agrobacterium TaxID=357 RepID=UPI000D1B2E37|nr:MULTISPECIES: outer membrane beta-barrel protein [Agrobacterium]MCD4659761.1 outer membrane beta-barrel protein [Agrobacterium sp.]MDH0910518.1 outer membrane beta-barrel protein [Agrobacterium pusense]MDH1098315.1 outer membrane beta-barrel protein [Agrobacterium pusense]MDH1115896.1 outer membrane beta-barrel protein [Agrobacterium pusense]MDH2195759.1 outer membrane beta-barrel protein [Agrobacterium pusense]